MDRRSAPCLCFLVLLLTACQALQAQPSGGPYGPMQQTYEVPADATHVYYVAPQGEADASGVSIDDPTTLESAIQRVVTGDAIILRGGVYRTGELKFNQGITLQPYRDEQPVLKGTKIASQWQRVRNGIWRTKWETLFPMSPQGWWRREREVMRTPLYKFNNDMVFVDGQLLNPKGWAGEIDRSSYWIDYEEGYVYLGIDPTDRLVEVTAYDNALTRTISEVHGKTTDGKGVTVRGITFTQYAYRAIEIEGHNPDGVSAETDHGKDVVGSTFEHCTFSFCSRVAGYFRGDHMTIRHCLVTDTGTEGIYLLSSNDALLEKNIITRTNIEGITGYYATAVKIFNQCYRVTCRDNLVIDNPDSSGIWYDVGNVDGVFVNNWVERTDNGFFFEISRGAICAGNVFVDCGTGARILNSRGVRLYNNTMVNSRLRIGRSERSAVNDHFGWHPATGPDVDERDGHVVVGNLFVADAWFRESLLHLDQTPALQDKLTDPQVAELDQNVYVHRAAKGVRPLITWSPSPEEGDSERLDSPEQLHAKYPAFAGKSTAYLDYHGPLFLGQQLKRFELLQSFRGSETQVTLPAEALNLLELPADAAPPPGAFPVR